MHHSILRAGSAAERQAIHSPALLERAQAELVIDIEGLLRPDALFALEIAGKYFIFILEADRATEPLETKNIRKSFRRTVGPYRKLIGEGIYRKKFGLKANALLLNITVSKKRRDHMVKLIGAVYPEACLYLFNHHLPELGGLFKPPPVMDLLDIAWRRAGQSPSKIGKI